MRNRTIEIELDDNLPIKQSIIKYLKSTKEAVPLGVIYKKFNHIAQRGVRHHISELSNEGIIKKVRCPCHISFLYTI